MKAPALIAAALLAACGSTARDAYIAHGADVASTGVGLAMGAAEANPLGAGLLVLKPAAVWWADSLPEPDRTQTLNVLGATGWAATAHNVCVLAFDPASVADCAALMIRPALPAPTHQPPPTPTREAPGHDARPAHPARQRCPLAR